MPPMAILAPLFAALGRFAGRALTTTLGWASTLLFGRVSKDRQVLLAAVTFGSVVWVALAVGVLVPDVGSFLLAFVPVPDFIDPAWVRIGMLVAAIPLPLLVGAAVTMLVDPADRGSGADLVKQVLRGYPLTISLAFVLVFLALVGTVRKLRVLVKRWSDLHIPLVVQPGGYEAVVGDLEAALDDAGLDVALRDAPAVLAMPGRLLATIAGPSVRRLVPERLRMLSGQGIEVLVHQSDIAISGGSVESARARAAIAGRLATSAAWRTTSDEAQAIEDRLAALVRSHDGHAATMTPAAAAELADIDRALATLEVDADEWEVLYRVRLQVERDLLAGDRPGQTFPGDPAALVTGSGPKTAGRAAPAELGLAAGVAALLALDIVVAVRERLAGRS